MRNHGRSDRDAKMDYESMALDVHGYLEQAGLDQSRVMLVGHSMGAKAAMTFAMMFPHLVDRLVSLDASPVDRTRLPHLNAESERMIEGAVRLGSLEGMPLEQAIKKIKREVEDPVLRTALLLNLNADGSY